TGMQGIVRDVTERKLAQQALRESHAMQRALLEAIPDGIFRIKKDGTLLEYISAEEFETIIPMEEFIGRKITETLPKDVSAASLELIKEALKTGDIKIHEYSLLLDGDVRDYEARMIANGDDEVLSIVRDVTERKRSEQALFEQKQLFENLVAVARATTEGPSLEKTLQNALDVAVDLTDADRGSLMLLDDESRVVNGIMSGEAVNLLNRSDVFGKVMNKGLAGWVARERMPALVHNIADDERWYKYAAQAYRHGSALIVPILSGNKTLGVLNLVNHEINHFTQDHQHLMQAAADQMALALQNAQMYEQQHQIAQRQSTLYETLRTLSSQLEPELVARKAVETVAKLTGWPGISVLLPEESVEGGFDLVVIAASGLSALGLGERTSVEIGVTGRAYRNVEIQIVPNVLEDPDYLADHESIRSEVAIPLRRGDRAMGVIDIQSEMPNGFSADDIFLAESLADAIALAYENAHFFNEIQKTAERLREVDRLKSTFLANMSHEIRTPLNGIIGMTHLLLDSHMPGEQRDMLETIRVSGDVLLSLINDILDFSKIEADRLELEKTPFVLQKCIDETLGLLTPAAQEKGLTLSHQFSEGVPHTIIGDGMRLRQILINLVSNAVKFTERGNVAVFVNATPWEDDFLEIHFAVKDTGIGISQESIGALFQPFSQVDASTTRNYGGTGLGLAISKRLTEMMDGEIWVESQLGKGSTFHFTILTEVASTDLQAEYIQSGLNGFETEQAAPAVVYPDLAAQQPLEILVAEDNQVNQKVILQVLGKIGYQADVVINGQEVLSAMRNKTYDVILMDVQMPELDGIEATRHIRAEWPPEQQPRIIALTAHALQEDRQRCLEAGMNDYIQKPFNVDTLVKSLGQAQPLSKQNGYEPVMPTKADGDLFEFESLVINSKALKSLQEMMSDDNLFLDLLDTYLQDSLGYITDIKRGVMEKNNQILERAAHTLKSSSATFGANGLAELCKELEQRGRAGKYWGAVKLLG
ncbi:MAG: GAF domain-containing protein, partial [Anaerolineae bacterium]|nr:GAF domain-containing protein [Anaerolineae bacterium]